MYPGIEIALAVILLIVAVAMIITTIAEGTMIALGVFVLAGGGGAALVYAGVTGYHSRFTGKHDAILRDLTRQGFRVASSDVYARGGNYLFGTEADLRAGSCIWAFNATKIDGTWRLTLPRPADNGTTTIKATDVAALRTVCG